MFVEHKFFVGARDINTLKELSNTSLLSYLEDVACMHSEMLGYGISNINTFKKTWVLLFWKVKVIKRPKFSDDLTAKTWSRLTDRYYAYRDFYVYNQDNDLVAIASSKWVLIDIENEKLVKIPEEVSSAYKPENISVFNDNTLEKLIEPKENEKKINYKITKNMIDINKHLHNIYYMDIAKEILPDEIAFSNELNEFEIMYKHEVKLGEIVKVLYSKQDDFHYITIKSEDEKSLHAIIKIK